MPLCKDLIFLSVKHTCSSWCWSLSIVSSFVRDNLENDLNDLLTGSYADDWPYGIFVNVGPFIKERVLRLWIWVYWMLCSAKFRWHLYPRCMGRPCCCAGWWWGGRTRGRSTASPPPTTASWWGRTLTARRRWLSWTRRTRFCQPFKLLSIGTKRKVMWYDKNL